MRLALTLLTATLLTGSLVACSGNSVPQTTPAISDVPVALPSSAILAKLHEPIRVGEADAVTPGIYAALGGSILGYLGNDRSNAPPACSLGGPSYPFDIAVDRQGDLLVPDYFARTITIYAGPGLCGPKLGTIVDPYGAPVDVASRNAANGGEIVVANVEKVGSVSVCTLSRGCTTRLSAGHRKYTSVALAPNGDCWATGGALVYFAHCRGHGVIASGVNVQVFRGIDIDDNGNLVMISSGTYESDLYIYSGCNPTCSLVGGPFQLHHRSGYGALAGYGHLNANSKQFVAAEDFGAQLDVYSYSTTGIKYEYSISNGVSRNLRSAAFSPSSKE